MVHPSLADLHILVELQLAIPIRVILAQEINDLGGQANKRSTRDRVRMMHVIVKECGSDVSYHA